jgi:hypothetical protein
MAEPKLEAWMVRWLREFAICEPELDPKGAVSIATAIEAHLASPPGGQEVDLLRRAFDSLKAISAGTNARLGIRIPSPGYHPNSLIGEIERFLTYADAQERENDD